MPDALIANSDYAYRVRHFAGLGFKAWEIARLLNLSEERVRVIVEATDARVEHTTSNC